MKQTLLYEVIGGEERLAVIEDGRLCELYVHRPGGDEAAGSIYVGRVDNVVRGMNAAFIDLGTEKNGFLYAGDVPGAPESEPRIEALLRPGQAVLVQVAKAQSGQKGHRLTGRVTLPGRGLALLPGQKQAGVSKKITEPEIRERLRNIAAALAEEAQMGVILRTAARDMAEADLRRELGSLLNQWQTIEARAAHAQPPTRVYDGDSLSLRCARDMLNEQVAAVWADGMEAYEALRHSAEVLAPDWSGRIQAHIGMTPLFDLYRVDAQLDKALRKYVWLKSGGSLVIEETEAMTVIDVNTGKFTGSKCLEDTLFKINCEAAEEIVRQLRLRNLGGIIIVDFIDMAEEAHNGALLDRLRLFSQTDRSRLTVVGMTGLGLVELTRKKDRRPLSRQLMHTCSVCGGDGAVPSHETTARRAIRDIWRRRRAGDASPLMIEAAAPVAGWIKTIGAPPGGAVYVCGREMPPGEYAVSPADPARLPEGCKRLGDA